MNTRKYRARVLGTRREKQWVRRVGDTFYKGENLYGKIDAAWERERVIAQKKAMPNVYRSKPIEFF